MPAALLAAGFRVRPAVMIVRLRLVVCAVKHRPWTVVVDGAAVSWQSMEEAEATGVSITAGAEGSAIDHVTLNVPPVVVFTMVERVMRGAASSMRR